MQVNSKGGNYASTKAGLRLKKNKFKIQKARLGLITGQNLNNATSVTVLAFSDYHSHAVPFYSEGNYNQAGIARAIAYLKSQQKKIPNLLVLSGGDNLNHGTPCWSDEYQGIELAWFNNLVDAMALGNHDLDYGAESFHYNQGRVIYPILCANFVNPVTNQPLLLTEQGYPYLIKKFGTINIGVFSLAGADFDEWVKFSNRPNGGVFVDRLKVAQQIVAELRDKEKVNAVIYFGHSSWENDLAMAQAVSGIDLILGSHSHYKSELIKLPQTETFYISPFQYLTYISKVQLLFNKTGKLIQMSGNLVKMDQTLPQDVEVAKTVENLSSLLRSKRPDRFEILGKANCELSYDGITVRETLLGNWVTDTLRNVAKAEIFCVPAISLRASLPPSFITVEDLYTAFPYKNSVVTAEITGEQILELLQINAACYQTENFSHVSGLRYNLNTLKHSSRLSTNLEDESQILVEQKLSATTTTYVALSPTKKYKIGSISYQVFINPFYKDFFKGLNNLTPTHLDVGTLLCEAIRNSSSITAQLDGRLKT